MEHGFRPGADQGAKNCLDVRDGRIVGKGIYCTPNPQVVECYSNGEEGKNQDGTEKGAACELVDEFGEKHTVFFALMCRVNPAAIRRPDRPFARCNDEEVMGIEGTFEWVINDAKDIRPYAVMIRDKETADHRSLQELVEFWNSEHKPKERGAFDNIPGKHLDPNHTASKIEHSYSHASKSLRPSVHRADTPLGDTNAEGELTILQQS